MVSYDNKYLINSMILVVNSYLWCGGICFRQVNICVDAVQYIIAKFNFISSLYDSQYTIIGLINKIVNAR